MASNKILNVASVYRLKGRYLTLELPGVWSPETAKKVFPSKRERLKSAEVWRVENDLKRLGIKPGIFDRLSCLYNPP